MHIQDQLSDDLDLRFSAGGELMNEYSTYDYFFNIGRDAGQAGLCRSGDGAPPEFFLEADGTLDKNTIPHHWD